MKNNKHAERFNEILKVISEMGIHTMDELKKPENEAVYTELWVAAQNFINYHALRSKSHRNAKGELVVGNAEKTRTLVERGLDLDDIRGNILVHILSKINDVLAQPQIKQSNYCYKIVNNLVYDEFRKLPPVGVSIFSIHDKVGNSGEDDTCEMEHFIADPTATEDVVMAWETVREIREAQRSNVLREIAALGKKPAEVLVWLCVKHLNMKPRTVAEMLLEYGAVAAYAKVLAAVANKYDIELWEVRCAIVEGKCITDESLKVDTRDNSQISAQISRISYRAGKRFDQ